MDNVSLAPSDTLPSLGDVAPRGSANVEAWLGRAPREVAQAVDRLLDEVERMRADQAIYPAQENILNALRHTGPTDVRAVILGQDPYHGPGQAMGLAFSVPDGVKLPPSLRNIFKELSADLGCPAPTSGDLTPWADRGVLLLNTVLTVREHAAGSHAKLGWQALTSWVVEECMALPQPVVFLAWGRPSLALIEGAIARVRERAGGVATAGTSTGAEPHVRVVASTHPSPLSANRAAGELPAFIGSRPFSRANDALRELGVEAIDWRL